MWLGHRIWQYQIGDWSQTVKGLWMGNQPETPRELWEWGTTLGTQVAGTCWLRTQS